MNIAKVICTIAAAGRKQVTMACSGLWHFTFFLLWKAFAVHM